MDFTVPAVYLREDVLQMGRDFATSNNKPYVFFPQTEYSALMICGDWDFQSYEFEHATIYRFAYVTGGTPGDPRRLTFGIYANDASGRLLNPNNTACYTSAAHTLQLVDKGVIKLETTLVFGLVLLMCWLIVRDIFSNVSRH